MHFTVKCPEILKLHAFIPQKYTCARTFTMKAERNFFDCSPIKSSHTHISTEHLPVIN